MSAESLLLRLALVGMIAVIAACTPEAKIGGETPTVTAPTAASTSAPPAPPVMATPTAAPAPEDDEMACRALCHIPDPSETFGAGAKHQPTSHKTYTTCLECHAAPPTPVAATTPVAPAVPATHLGRLDPACAGCHVTK